MARAHANGIEIEYEEYGNSSDPVVLMIAGIGVQLVGWDVEFIGMLAGRGYRVVIFDNRDAGLSTGFADACPSPGLLLMRALGGAQADPPYTLSDIADDSAALLEAIGIGSAHVLGVSLGGMIAQLMAVRHPDRVRSLMSIMASPSIPEPNPELLKFLITPTREGRDAAVNRAVESARAFSGGRFEVDAERMRERAGESYDRNPDRSGATRQMLAIFCDGSRRDRLREVTAPTLVIHGDSDPLVNLEAGRETASLIPGARLHIVRGMGHELPVDAWSELLEVVVEHADASERRRSDAA